MTKTTDYKATTEIVLVNPDMAAKWLEGNIHNRPLMQQTANRYSFSMKAGLWQLTPEPIIFNEDGHLIDGQHRLWAVVLAGVAVWFTVTKNAPKAVQLVLDQGATRHAADNLNLAGEMSQPMTHDDYGVLTHMIGGFPGLRMKVPAEFLGKIWPHYSEYILGVKEACGGRTGTPTGAMVRSICARAVTTKPKDKVYRFCHALATGEMRNGTEKVAIRLRDLLLVDWRTGCNRPTPGSQYSKIESALGHFLSGTCPERLKGVEQEMFPIPQPQVLIRLKEQYIDSKRQSVAMARKVNGRRDVESITAHRVIDTLRHQGKATIKEIVSQSDIPSATVKALMSSLIASGKVVKGPGREPSYSLSN